MDILKLLVIVAAITGGIAAGCLWSNLGGTALYHEAGHVAAFHIVYRNDTSTSIRIGIGLDDSWTTYRWGPYTYVSGVGRKLGGPNARHAFIAFAGSIPQFFLQIVALSFGAFAVCRAHLLWKAAGLFFICAAFSEYVWKDLLYTTAAAVKSDAQMLREGTGLMDFPEARPGEVVFSARQDWVTFAMNLAWGTDRSAQWIAQVVAVSVSLFFPVFFGLVFLVCFIFRQRLAQNVSTV